MRDVAGGGAATEGAAAAPPDAVAVSPPESAAFGFPLPQIASCFTRHVWLTKHFPHPLEHAVLFPSTRRDFAGGGGGGGSRRHFPCSRPTPLRCQQPRPRAPNRPRGPRRRAIQLRYHLWHACVRLYIGKDTRRAPDATACDEGLVALPKAEPSLEKRAKGWHFLTNRIFCVWHFQSKFENLKTLELNANYAGWKMLSAPPSVRFSAPTLAHSPNAPSPSLRRMESRTRREAARAPGWSIFVAGRRRHGHRFQLRRQGHRENHRR